MNSKELLKQVLTQLGRPDLANMVGTLPEAIILKKLMEMLEPEDRKVVQTLIDQAKTTEKARSFLIRMKQTKPSTFPSDHLIGAMMRGIHPETYTHNQALPIEEKLKLPVWEAIYALNIKDKPNENKNQRRHSRKRI